MKKRMAWRYTCEFCGKSNCSGSAISKHERHCTKNPDRVCRMCARVGDKQATMPELIASIHYEDQNCSWFGGEVKTRKLDRLRQLSNNCPACMLAALRQINEDAENPIIESDNFHFKDESKVWIEDYRSSMIGDMSGDSHFDRDEWVERRAKRFQVKTTV